MSAAFDTLRIARDLEAAGVERRQAEAHAEALRIVADSARAEAATKADLATTAAKLASKADLAGFATKADLAGFATKADLAGFATKADLAGFATKADLAGFATKADLAGFATKADLETAIAELETRMLKYGLGMVLANVSLTVALIKLL